MLLLIQVLTILKVRVNLRGMFCFNIFLSMSDNVKHCSISLCHVKHPLQLPITSRKNTLNSGPDVNYSYINECILYLNTTEYFSRLEFLYGYNCIHIK